MRNDFGTRAWGMLWENVDPVLVALVRRCVLDGLRRNEPRIRVEKVEARVEDTAVVVSIVYVWQNKQVSDSFEYERRV